MRKICEYLFVQGNSNVVNGLATSKLNDVNSSRTVVSLLAKTSIIMVPFPDTTTAITAKVSSPMPGTPDLICLIDAYLQIVVDLFAETGMAINLSRILVIKNCLVGCKDR